MYWLQSTSVWLLLWFHDCLSEGAIITQKFVLELLGGLVNKHICQWATPQTFWNSPKICMSKIFQGNVATSGNSPRFTKILQVWRSGMFQLGSLFVCVAFVRLGLSAQSSRIFTHSFCLGVTAYALSSAKCTHKHTCRSHIYTHTSIHKDHIRFSV